LFPLNVIPHAVQRARQTLIASLELKESACGAVP
jgi:hypothetical protein